MKKIILYVHGKGGSSQEINEFTKNIRGFDYDNKNLSHIMERQIKAAYNMTSETRSMLS